MKQLLLIFLMMFSSVSLSLLAQNANANLSGTIQDASGAVVPKAEVILMEVQTGTRTTVKSDSNGAFSFPNLSQGEYEITVQSSGFEKFVQQGIKLDLNSTVRVPIVLKVGNSKEEVVVNADASAVNFDTPEVKGTIAPLQISTLPLEVAGSERSAAAFVTLLPGANGGITGTVNSAQFDGGQYQSDEAVLDGISMEEGALSQSGITAINADFPISPDAVGEISVLTSNYDVRYGSSASAVIVASTKAGSSSFHGSGYDYERNGAMDATQWGVTSKQKHLEHDYGFAIGGPAKLPFIMKGNRKTFFFFDYEGYRSAGSSTKPLLTVPTLKMRSGDFSEWPYPVYDPTTSQNVGGTIVRQQFMGCDGTTPNVICSTNPWIASSLASGWLKYVPQPNRSGLVANYEPPTSLPGSLGSANTNTIHFRVDEYLAEKHHFYVSYYERSSLNLSENLFPKQIDTTGWRYPNVAQMVRFNYDYIIAPSLLNHFAAGYLNLYSEGRDAATPYVSQVPEIAGVYSHDTTPGINFGDSYSSYGATDDFHDNRPTYIITDDLTWVRSRHQLDFGVDARRYSFPRLFASNGAGTFNFTGGATSVLGQQSGNAYADFLLGAVGSANIAFYGLPRWTTQGGQVALFAGDNWKPTTKLSLTYGVRWDYMETLYEQRNRMSFLDLTGANTDAGNLPGRLAFSGNSWGAASYGSKYPEKPFYGGLAPRLGVVFSPDSRTAVRAGYGISFMTYTPGWGGIVATDGFNTTASFVASDGGLTAPFLLQNGVPQDFQKPPYIDSTVDNGHGAPSYRTMNGSEDPYAQQWNLTIERQVSTNVSASVGYVANKGTRLFSQLQPLNILPPSALALGSKLADQFQGGAPSLDGVSAPYSGWATQMTSCSPSVAQAMLRFPQYCGQIYGADENLGNSTYHSLQAKAEKRFSGGLFFLGSYTWSKSLTDSPSAQIANDLGTQVPPSERWRAKALAGNDIPNIVALSYIYDLPFGQGKHFHGDRAANAFIGGWQVSGITRFSGGAPFEITSSYCNLGGGNFGASCLPGQLSGVSPFQHKGSWAPGKGVLLNVAAFESASKFNYYWGTGRPYANIRSFGYSDFDFALAKEASFEKHVDFRFKVEAFNAFNEHSFGSAAVTDVASPSFGEWNGSVTAPRNLQLSGRITF